MNRTNGSNTATRRQQASPRPMVDHDNRWTEYTREPCPICNSIGWCCLSPNEDLVWCHREPGGCWKGKTAKNGDVGYLHKLYEDAVFRMPPPKKQRAESLPPAADSDTCHKVYSGLLALLTLSDEHRAALKGRGFDDEEIEARGYRTIPEHDHNDIPFKLQMEFGLPLFSVPGFWKNSVNCPEISARNAMLIPERDLEGRIIRIKVRPDYRFGATNKPKYYHLSSAKHDGPSSGTPVHVPIGMKLAGRMVGVTEGPLKADAAFYLSGDPIIAVGGVGLWDTATAVLKAAGAIGVRLAFDADAKTNPNVARSVRNAVKGYREAGFAVELLTWDEADGKGIDDLYHGGKTPDVLTGDDVDAAILEFVASSGLKDEPEPMAPTNGHANGQVNGQVGPVVNDDTETTNEAPDDPHRLARLYRDEQSPHPDGPSIRFWKNQYLRWGNSRYTPLEESEIKADLGQSTKREFDRLNRVEVAQWAENSDPANPDLSTKPVTRKVTGRLMSDVSLALGSMTLLPSTMEQPAWLGDNPPFAPNEILATSNALVHLPSFVAGQPCQVPPTPLFFSANALDYGFNPDAPPLVEWLKFLAQVLPEDSESVETLQEWFGYLLTPDTSQQKIFMLIGGKRSGKGTIVRVLRELIGTANVANPTLSSLATQFGLEPLIGKSAAIITDARISGHTDTATIVERLLSISGEDGQTIDRKHRLAITIKLLARFMLISNELPRVKDSSGALSGRMILVRMTQSFYGREDTQLLGRLLPELPGILLWAIEGWKRLQARGHFLQPQSALPMVQQMEDLASPIGAFLRECCILGPAEETETGELRDRWDSWCKANRKEYTLDSAGFGRDLHAAIPGLTTPQVRRPVTDKPDRRVRIYRGVGLKPEDRPAQTPPPVTDDAVDAFLNLSLGHGQEIAHDQLIADAKGHKISRDDLFKSKERLGVKARQDKATKSWFWWMDRPTDFDSGTY